MRIYVDVTKRRDDEWFGGRMIIWNNKGELVSTRCVHFGEVGSIKEARLRSVREGCYWHVKVGLRMWLYIMILD